MDWAVNGILEIFGLLVSGVLHLLLLFPDVIIGLLTGEGLTMFIQIVNEIVGYFGNFPSFLVYATGINPPIWNLMISVVIASIVWTPVIGLIKYVLGFIKR